MLGTKLRSVFSAASRTIWPKTPYQTSGIKTIVETKTDKKLVIEGVLSELPWKSRLLQAAQHPTSCPLCTLGLDVKHTDVLILSQFVRSDGCMLARRVTGLCKTQHQRVKYMVAMAQKAGLMMNMTPKNCKQDVKLRPKWKKFNTYFDESTIRPPRAYRKREPQLFTYI